ncbi:alpha/beta fold hydrolase [uncultured Tessaracoccus sp.]|uniref:alpha/beta fold hydrolase n=1 Tax=uncultured Tessaracoccus sp. TaxID=905023 RepID=UPI0026352A70|nr:alpha/beta hydrolase [uncultured Tessaracoccus sp.]
MAHDDHPDVCWERIECDGTSFQVLHTTPDGPAAQRPTFVLVHGLGVSGFYFEPLIRELADHAPVVVFDLPGAGRTAESDGALTIASLADVLHEVIQQLDLGKVVLVGHSMGTQVVVEALARYPELADAAALLAPVVPPSARKLGPLLAHFVRTSWHEPFAAVWRAFVGYLQMAPSWLWKQTQAMLHYPMEERIRDVRADLILIRATHDYVAPRDFLAQLRAAAGGQRTIMREMPNAAHHMMATHADALTAEILRVAHVHDPKAATDAAENLRRVTSQE